MARIDKHRQPKAQSCSSMTGLRLREPTVSASRTNEWPVIAAERRGDAANRVRDKTVTKRKGAFSGGDTSTALSTLSWEIP